MNGTFSHGEQAALARMSKVGLKEWAEWNDAQSDHAKAAGRLGQARVHARRANHIRRLMRGV